MTWDFSDVEMKVFCLIIVCKKLEVRNLEVSKP